MKLVEETEPDNEWLPDSCPPWCEGEHAVALAETGDWVAAQEHHRYGYGDAMHELRHRSDGRVMRPGGGAWDSAIRQRSMPGGGYLNEPTIDLRVEEGLRQYVEVRLTSGEARVMAAQLSALADVLDMPNYDKPPRR